MTTTPTDPVVEMYVQTIGWVDITADVRLSSAHSGGGIDISRGEPNEGSSAEPTSINMVINNRDGKYSPRNPNSPYFGLIGRNTPVRVGMRRRSDTFNGRSVSNGWGQLSDGKGGWSIGGISSNFQVGSNVGQVLGQGGSQTATHDTLYGDVDQLVRFRTSSVAAAASEVGLIASTDFTGGIYWWAVSVVPNGATGQLKIQRAAPGNTITQSANIGTHMTFQANTWYWLRMQIRGGIRCRGKIWADTAAEQNQFGIQRMDYPHDAGLKPPLVGRAGTVVTGGSSVVQFDSYESTMWRAYGEISNFPVRWDLSRQDRWVPIEAKGVLRRLGQGKKELESAVYRHLNSYTDTAVIWHPLEESGDALNAPTPLENAETALTSGISYASDTTLIPGIKGYATLSEAGDSIIGTSRPGIPFANAAWTFLLFFRVPNNPTSDMPIATVKSTGNVIRWELTLNGQVMTINGFQPNGSVLTTDSLTLNGFSDIPIGSWVAMTLTLSNVSTTTTWVVNYLRPGGAQFWTSGNNTFTGFPGLVTSYQITANAATNAAGGLSVAHAMVVYRDLPFVSVDFARASAAYVDEYAFDRYIRLCRENKILYSFSGFQNETEKMGPQLPEKVLELLKECAQSSGAFLGEARENSSIEFRTRKTVYARTGLQLSVDDGHISAPCEPVEDDQATRNDVKVNRAPLGGFYRTLQSTGPLNTSAPEANTGGVGVFDEAVDFNVAQLSQLSAIGNFRLAKGTLMDVRYPDIHLDFTASAYQASDALALAAASLEAGDTIQVVNPEVSPDPSAQLVYAYAETLDQFDWDMVLTTKPAEVYRAGLLNRTTRLDTAYSYTYSTFVSGLDTRLQVSRSDPARGFLWVSEAQKPEDFPFDVMVSGVRLRVTGNGDNLMVASGTFEANTSGWTVANANITLARSTALARSGVASMLITAVSGTLAVTGPVVGPTTATMAPVTPGTTYTLSMWVQSPQALTDVRAQLDFYQSNGTYITSLFTLTAQPMTANTWQSRSWTGVAPVNAAFLSTRIRAVMSTGDTLYIDDVRITSAAQYASDPQVLIVEQTPVNGVAKAIPTGRQVRVQAPWRMAW